jgi:hypothetical protein
MEKIKIKTTYELCENEVRLPNGKIRKLDRIYSIEEVLSKVNSKKKKDSGHVFDGDLIYMNSLRYHTFLKGVKCMCGDPECHIVGRYFRKERTNHTPRYHFNLYGIDADGSEVLMTKDHIIPSSRGGKDVINNLQTMSEPCNMRKGNKVEVIK